MHSILRSLVVATVAALLLAGAMALPGVAVLFLMPPAEVAAGLGLPARVAVACFNWSLRLLPILVMVSAVVQLAAARLRRSGRGGAGRFRLNAVAGIVSLGTLVIALAIGWAASGFSMGDLPKALALGTLVALAGWIALALASALAATLVDWLDSSPSARALSAWLAALCYLAAGVYSLGTGFAWWRGTSVELAFLAGLGGVFLLWVIGPVARLVWPDAGPAARATRALAFAAAALAAVSALVLTISGGILRISAQGHAASARGMLSESPWFWLLTLGLLCPWLVHLNVAARKAGTWPWAVAGLGFAGGVAGLLVPVTFLDPPLGGLALSTLVAVVGGVAVPLWLLLLSARLGPPSGAVRLAAVTVLPVAALLLGVNLWAQGRLAVHQRDWVKDLAAERARIAALRMPVLRGEPVDCNAADRYVPLTNGLFDTGFPSGKGSFKRDPDLDRAGPAVNKAAAASPFAALPAEVLPVLDSRRALIATLREATRCQRVDWGYRYELGPDAPVPSLLGARWLANLTVVAGHARAQAGDLQGAAEHYLDTIRFGAHLQSQGVLVAALVGLAVQDTALRLEQARARERRYPAELRDLPADPFAADAARIHYRLEAGGAGYTLWSVGRNHKDDGGTDDDIVLARRAR